MSLLITLLKAPGSVAVDVPSMAFDEQGGSMGRGPENKWVLQDPDLFLSSLHCEVVYENGRYYLLDRSTNGTFYNGAQEPMGKGGRIAINDQDQFIIGDYEFAVQLQQSGAQPFVADDPFSDVLDNVPAASNASLDNFAETPFGGGLTPADQPIFSSPGSESDPLAALDRARGGSSSIIHHSGSEPQDDYFASPTQADGADALSQQMDWPTMTSPASQSVANIIPDDWDMDDDKAEPVVAPVQQATAPESGIAAQVQPSAREKALEIVNRKLMAKIKKLESEKQIPHTPATVSDNDIQFMRALGLHDKSLANLDVAKTSEEAGEVMRAMIAGLMRVLSSRSSIKNEFRMNVTTIQPVENNPLKFSANVDDALENMFVKSGNAFKQPLDAVNEGFESIAEHQIAILAGIREAFKAVIERFDPLLLEEKFSRQNRGGLLPGSQKAKNWEAFIDYYQELVGDIDQSFQFLFGDGFVRAYEDQLQKLAISRKSRGGQPGSPLTDKD